MKQILISVLLLFGVCSNVAAQTGVPKTISFQGYLTDKNTNDPLNGNFDMKFSLYDAVTGGTELWFDDYTGVTVTKGLYTVILGDKKPITLPFDKIYYLQIKIGLENLDPRITLTSSPYSLSATNASTITSGTLDNLRLDPELQDLADGELSGSLIGPGINAANIVGSFNTSSFANGSVSSDKLQSDASVDANRAVTTDHIRDNAITASKISSNSVTSSKLQSDASVDANRAVTTNHIRDNAITASKVLDKAITSAKLQSDAGTDANRAVTTDHIRDNAITTSKISNGTIVDADISNSAAISGSKVVPSFGSQNISTTGTISANTFSGSGSSLTSIPAASLTGSNTLPAGVLPTTVPIGNGTNGNVTFWTGASTVNSSANLFWDNTNGRLGIGSNAPLFTLDVKTPNSSNAAGIRIQKSVSGTNDMILFYNSGFLVGNIAENAGTVSYNSFTGSHYGRSTDQFEFGMLSVLEGPVQHLTPDIDSEPIYSVRLSTTANDPRVLGAYFGELGNGTQIKTFMAVGNGTMWVADTGRDLKPGDFLISSSIAGHAMLDAGDFELSYVIARVGEEVNWADVTETVDGTRHKKISVFFETFIRNHKAEALAREVDEMKNELKLIRDEWTALKAQLEVKTPKP